jgi:hypothetical protein
MLIQWAVGAVQLLPLLSNVSAVVAYTAAVWWLLCAAGVQFILQVATATKAEPRRSH